MTGHLRFCFAAFVLLAGLSTSPASSNPFAGWFNATPAEDAARTSTEEECLPRPGKSTADGQHWVYRLDGHRKCWFQTAGTATVKKPVQRHAAKHRVATPEENKTATRKPKAPVDALAELLLRSPPAETSQPAKPALEVADAGPVLVTQTAPLVPGALVRDDQLMPRRPTPPQVDIEALLAAAPAAGDVVTASAPSTMPVALAAAEARDGEWGWTWLGVLLMALGLVSVISSSRTIRGAVLLHRLGKSFRLPKAAAGYVTWRPVRMSRQRLPRPGSLESSLRSTISPPDVPRSPIWRNVVGIPAAIREAVLNLAG